MVKVQVLSGMNSIGGNFVRIEDGDTKIAFDNGMRFDLFKRFYSGFISPSGVGELRELGIVPREEWYEELSDLYVSHLHMDHIGLPSNIPVELTLHVPSLDIYNQMEERWSKSPTWLSLAPRKYFVKVEEIRAGKLGDNLEAIPVSHSAFPAYAFLYHGSDETVLYTGDFRLTSFLSEEEFESLCGAPSLLRYLEDEGVRVDKLVVEGTNFGVGKVPLLADEGFKLMERIVGSSQLTIATSHYLDVEFLRAVVRAAQGSSVLIASKVMSQFLRRDMFAELEEPLVAEEYVKGVPDLDMASIYDYELSSEKLVIITSYYELIDLVRNLREWSVSLSDMTVMLSEPEPRQEESVDYEALLRWMDILGILTYRVRVSGHYYPFELTKLISTVKTKQVIPIHTLHPRLVLTLAHT